jgi:ATP-dependent Clp protease ATP-binding subunit ClpA
MFNRFTSDARAVVERAQEESAALGHTHLGTEHMLLAIASRGGLPAALGLDHGTLQEAVRELSPDLDAAALAAIGIDLDAVRRAVERSFGPGALNRARRRAHARFCPQAKRALELSLREAVALGDHHIGSQHILLGLVHDPECGAVRALERCDTTPGTVRRAVLDARREAA